MFGVTCLGTVFMEMALGPRKHEKYYDHVSHPGRTGMQNVARRSQRMQKHKFGVTCPDVLFIESVPVPPEHEKYCDNVSRPDTHPTGFKNRSLA
jgi:hypothetical protein